jgi:hypothetical protein
MRGIDGASERDRTSSREKIMVCSRGPDPDLVEAL